MKDDLRLMGIATRIFHGRPTDREDAEAIRQATTRFTDRIAALEAKLAEKDALLRECGEGLAGPNAWLERWASHVGGCHGGSLCQCGLTLARLESATTLAKIKDATDG